MKQFKGYEDAKKSAQYANTPKLPVGAYVCKVMAVRYEEGKDGKSDAIALSFDIIEGEYKDFFKTQYETNTADDKKWKGVIRIYVPNDDGSEKDGWTKAAFARWMDAFEQSNKGYSWDWDEAKLKNKKIGIVYGETGTVIEGREVKYAEPRFGVPVEKVKNGTAPQAKFKAKNGYGKGLPQGEAADGFMAAPADMEDFPF